MHQQAQKKSPDRKWDVAHHKRKMTTERMAMESGTNFWAA